MVQTQSKLDIQKGYVSQLLEQLIVDYQNTKPERKGITERYPSSEDEFSLLEELDLLTTSIRGYASQIKAQGTVKNFQQALEDLKQLNALEIPIVTRFFFENRSHYGQTKIYIQTLDYLRLLVLDYLRSQQSIHSISAGS